MPLTAKEARELTEENLDWISRVELNQILHLIEERSNEGGMVLYVYEAVQQETIKKLEELEYNIIISNILLSDRISKSERQPYYTIYW